MQAARLMLVVVFPQPPFWLMIAMIRMANLPWFTRCPTRHGCEKRPAPRGGVPSVGFLAPSPIRPPEPPAGLLVQIGEWCVETLGLWDRGGFPAIDHSSAIAFASLGSTRVNPRFRGIAA